MTSGHWPSSFKVNTFVRWFAKSPRWVSKSPWHTDWTKKSHLVRLRRCLRYWNVWDNENELWVTAKTANRWCSMWEKVKQFSKVVDQLTRSMSDSSSLSDVSFGEVCPKSQISNLGPKSQISNLKPQEFKQNVSGSNPAKRSRKLYKPNRFLANQFAMHRNSKPVMCYNPWESCSGDRDSDPRWRRITTEQVGARRS